jgi:HEAT repeat protein
MCSCHPICHSALRPLALLALTITFCLIPSIFAQTAFAEPVEELRSTLRAPCADPAQRARSVQARIQAVQGIGDLRRALVLRDWRDQDQDERVAAVDRSSRLALARRFEQAVRDVLRQGDEVRRLAVLSVLTEIGTTVHGVGTSHGIARGFGPDLAELAQHGDAAVREVAARTLGQIDPEPDIAVAAFRCLLSAEDPSQRLAAADGIVCWMRTMAQLATSNRTPESIEVTRADLATVGRAVVPLAARGLRAEQPEIRRRSVQAIGYAATTLHNWILAADSPEVTANTGGLSRLAQEDRAQLFPLILALREEGSALTHALVDADAEVRFRAGRVLEDLKLPQQMLLPDAMRSAPQRETPPLLVVGPPIAIPSPAAHHREAPDRMVQVLAAQLTDADTQVRRAALDNLETLGPDAAPATAALVAALADSDKFVRWAAARTLGRISPVHEEAVVPALALLLTDADLDARLAAVAAFQRMGPAARAVVPDLRRTIASTDAELRAAAIRALADIGGPEAYAAVPELSAAVADTDARVRQAAAQVLGRFGFAARDAAPALCRALADTDPEVQKKAGEALLNILRPGKE